MRNALLLVGCLALLASGAAAQGLFPPLLDRAPQLGDRWVYVDAPEAYTYTAEVVEVAPWLGGSRVVIEVRSEPTDPGSQVSSLQYWSEWLYLPDGTVLLGDEGTVALGQRATTVERTPSVVFPAQLEPGDRSVTPRSKARLVVVPGKSLVRRRLEISSFGPDPHGAEHPDAVRYDVTLRTKVTAPHYHSSSCFGASLWYEAPVGLVAQGAFDVRGCNGATLITLDSAVVGGVSWP